MLSLGRRPLLRKAQRSETLARSDKEAYREAKMCDADDLHKYWAHAKFAEKAQLSLACEGRKMSWFVSFLLFGLGIGLLLNLYFKRLGQFWKTYRVPHTQPRFPLGDLEKSTWSKNIGVLFKEFYDKFPGERFFGIWMFINPSLVVKDLDLIKAIFVKDFNYFQDRKVYFNERDDPLSAHLFSIEGQKWKNLRAKLSPTFTSGKMKMMFPLVVECGQELEQHLNELVEKGEMMMVKDVVARFMTDVISLCAFGIRTNSLKDPKAKFREMGRKIMKPSLRSISIMIFQFCAPKMSEILRMRVLPKDVSEYFLQAVKDVMESREKLGIVRNDFMQLLMQLKNEGAIEDAGNQSDNGSQEKLTLEEAAAEAFVFFVAGFETSSSTVQFALYELAKNPGIQEKLRKEILDNVEKHGNRVTYEGSRELPYLEQVIDETLRKYPVVPTLQRECKTNYQIPDSDAIIPEGTIIHVPVYAIHMDEKYYPDPEKFDPERFSEDEKQKRHHYAYLPFGEGPRNCIGKRFGQMQVRLALMFLLRSFNFQLPEQLRNNSPLVFDPNAFVLSVKEEILLKVSRI